MTRRVCKVLVCAMAVWTVVPSTVEAAWPRWLGYLEQLSGPGPYEGITVSGEIYCGGRATGQQQEFVLASLSDKERAQVRKLFENSSNTADESSEQSGSMKQGDMLTKESLKPQGADIELLAMIIEQATRCAVDRHNIKYRVVLEYSRWFDEDNPAFAGDAHISSIQGLLYVPLARINPSVPVFRAVDLGVGLGFYSLSGSVLEDPDWFRPTVPLRVKVIPSELFYGGAGPSDGSGRRAGVRKMLQSIQWGVGWDFLPGTVRSRSFKVTDPTRDSEESREWVFTMGLQVDLLLLGKGMNTR